MKRIAIMLMVFCIVANVATADSVMGRVSGLIKDDLFKNAASIENESSQLTESEKLILYSDFKKDNILPFVLNFLVGIGLGSFIQGDSTGGWIAVAGDMAGIGLLAVGYVGALNSVYGSSGYSSGITMIGISEIILAGTRIFECIRPFTFASRYNTTLKKSIKYYDRPSLSLVPSMNGEKLAMSVMYSVKLN